MKIAFVHDRLLTIGGAEKVFFEIIKDYVDFDIEIFTVFSDKKEIIIKNKSIKINSVISNNYILNKIGYRNLMPIFPIFTNILSKKINKYNPQKTIISSFAIAKNINVKSITQLYLHSPMQYIWDSYEEYIDKFHGIKKFIFKLVCKYLRLWDKQYVTFNSVDFNSEYTAKLAKEIYNIDGKVKYPPIPDVYLKSEICQNPKDYFIYIGRIVKFSKEVDKIIQLFNFTGDKLVIVGSGPDESELKGMSNENIKYLGYISDDTEICRLLKQSIGLINITKESYGIVTAQALACGVPVFGYNQGQTKFLVENDQGLLIENKNIDEIINNFLEFKKIIFDRDKIKRKFITKYRKNINL